MLGVEQHAQYGLRKVTLLSRVLKARCWIGNGMTIVAVVLIRLALRIDARRGPVRELSLQALHRRERLQRAADSCLKLVHRLGIARITHAGVFVFLSF